MLVRVVVFCILNFISSTFLYGKKMLRLVVNSVILIIHAMLFRLSQQTADTLFFCLYQLNLHKRLKDNTFQVITVYTMKEISSIPGLCVTLASTVFIPIHAAKLLYQTKGSFLQVNNIF